VRARAELDVRALGEANLGVLQGTIEACEVAFRFLG